MKPSIKPLFALIDRGLLCCAAQFVPGLRRADWLREWQAELWHVRQERAPMEQLSWQAEREIACFCLGAFQDATCLSEPRWRLGPLLAALRGSAAQCLLMLFALLAVSYGIARLSPGVRAERMLSTRLQNPGLILIQNADGDSTTIAPQQYLAWKKSRHSFFDGFAFYRITEECIQPERETHSALKEPWKLAQASSNLLPLLGLPVRFATAEPMASSDLPSVILSESFWKIEFGANPHITGSVVRIGQRRARVAGVVAEDSWNLPGKVGAWLVQPDSTLAANGDGFIVAHLTPAGREKMWAPVMQITEDDQDDYGPSFLGYNIDEWQPGSWGIYWLGIAFALISLPAVTSVSLGEYSLNPHKTSWGRRLYRWSFFCAKTALLLPIVYFLTLDLAYIRTAQSSHSSANIQMLSTFAFFLFGLRWALLDHRQRCPVCLRRVEHPVEVGLASRTFLAWNGTEMMCMGGHTLLHIPALPTSWFDAQRWLYLDTSWEFLFAGPGVG
jgi:hypothetical protein